LEAKWKNAVKRFVLNNLGQLDQEDFDAWLDGEADLAPLLEPALRAMKGVRDPILAEMHMLSPAEIYDRFRIEHPEIEVSDSQRAIVRIGKELELMKAVLCSL